MSYLYQLKDGANIEKIKEIGFDYLPAELYGTEEENNILYKIIPQPTDGQCVKTLINFYESIAPKICKDKNCRRAHEEMGIKFKRLNKKWKLIVTDSLKEIFSLWRLEIDLITGDVYFTISDGNLPRFYDAEQVMEKYCKEDIDVLVMNDIIERVENVVA